ncbi:hypothetical protein FKW77_003157 [Venturia effusa]|uniref:Uncharacterized protein n=1 Tax=Venturia effusa TaxID=50376 RepID=A0A517L0Z8_9PEZI|nr:hypothetical protein FKW77_003157 [Venturia effusa]
MLTATGLQSSGRGHGMRLRWIGMHALLKAIFAGKEKKVARRKVELLPSKEETISRCSTTADEIALPALAKNGTTGEGGKESSNEVNTEKPPSTIDARADSGMGKDKMSNIDSHAHNINGDVLQPALPPDAKTDAVGAGFGVPQNSVRRPLGPIKLAP